jgi:4-hydroxy-3-methylbut-2-en-1-yl diphosphate reductase
MLMKISIDTNSGFCYGVVRVIRMAEELLKNGEAVWCLGQIVHNEEEVKRLEQLGMKFIDHKDLPNLRNALLIVRAHGEPPSTYEIAKENNLKIVEGTCPIVQKLQKKIKTEFEQEEEENHSIIIFGKENHPEVISLMGQINDKAIVIRNVEEAKSIPLKKNAALFSQTTMDSIEFSRIASILQERVSANGGMLKLNNTICGHVSHRKPGLVKFSKENDVIVFVGGKKSSNAKVLFEICKSTNEKSYFISTPDEIQPEWFDLAASTGISGATSTPVWQLENVAAKIKDLSKN